MTKHVCDFIEMQSSKVINLSGLAIRPIVLFLCSLFGIFLVLAYIVNRSALQGGDIRVSVNNGSKSPYTSSYTSLWQTELILSDSAFPRPCRNTSWSAVPW